MSALNTLVAYKFIKLISTKFENWDAYKLGLIDKNGKTLKHPESDEEKKSLGIFEKLVKNIKIIINKAPLGSIAIGSLIVALKLLKENAEEEGYDYHLLESKLLSELDLHPTLNEDVESTLEAGKYKDEGGNIYVVFEDLLPVDTILNENIYSVKNVVTRETVYTSKYLLTRV